MDDLRVVVAKLRAKAAATSFPLEAETFAAKADELEARAGPPSERAKVSAVKVPGGYGVVMTLRLEDIARTVISKGACNHPPLR